MESILDAIGNTPLVRLHRCAPANGAELWLIAGCVSCPKRVLLVPEALVRATL